MLKGHWQRKFVFSKLIEHAYGILNFLVYADQRVQLQRKLMKMFISRPPFCKIPRMQIYS